MLIPLKYNLRSLGRRRIATAATAAGIGLTVAVFIATMGLVEGMRNTFVSTGDPLNLHVIRQGSQTEPFSVLDREVAETIATLAGIAADARGRPQVSAELVVLVNQQRRGEASSSNLLFRGVDETGRALRPQVRLIAGRWPQPGLRELAVSRTIAERFQDCGLGEQPLTGNVRWTVVGVFDAGSTAYGSELWAEPGDIANAFDRVVYSAVLLRARDAAALASLRDTIENDRRLQLKAAPEPDYFAEQTPAATPLRMLGNVIALIMAVGSAFAAMNTMYAAVAARSREVAVLRVLGFSPASVLVSFLVESLILAGFGAFLGVLLALPLDGLATGTANWLAFSEMTFQYRITPGLLARGVFFAVVMGAAGGLLPAARAARRPVALALRAL